MLFAALAWIYLDFGVSLRPNFLDEISIFIHDFAGAVAVDICCSETV